MYSGVRTTLLYISELRPCILVYEKWGYNLGARQILEARPLPPYHTTAKTVCRFIGFRDRTSD